MKKKKFPLKDLWVFLQDKYEFDLLNELKKKKFDISTSRRGFAIIRLQEEKLYESFILYAQRLYPDKEFLIQSALNKYNKYEAVPEAEYVNLNYNGKTRFSPAEIKQLKFYVYELTDPDNDEVFYVGKGMSNRVYTHLKKALNGDPSAKGCKIRDILKNCKKPKLNIIKQGMSESDAYNFESNLIENYGIENLTNVQSGKRNRLKDNGIFFKKKG